MMERLTIKVGVLIVDNNFEQIFKTCKVFYGQEPPSGESTATEYGFNYQLLAVMY